MTLNRIEQALILLGPRRQIDAEDQAWLRGLFEEIQQLRSYVQHRWDCDALDVIDADGRRKPRIEDKLCSCGLDDVLKAIR